MRCAAITNNRNHLDHLAPLCYIMQMPLIVPQQKIYDLCKKYYPQVDVHLLDFVEFTPTYFSENFDVLFLSGKYWINWMHQFSDLLTKKIPRFVYCPHGNSDKTFGYEHVDKVLRHDIHLVYGDQMFNFLKDHDLLKFIHSTIPTGNYRYQFYQRFQTEFDQIAQDEIFSQFAKPQSTILYAPTWKDLEDSSTFLDTYQKLLDTLPSHINLVIKLHPLLERYHPAHAYHLIEKTRELPNVATLLEEPIVYPIMQLCDAYLGDYSSVGYDFLSFKKPMFFAGKPQISAKIHQCGMQIEGNPFATIEKHLDQRFRSQQDALYDEAFRSGLSLESIASEIQNSLSPKA